MPLITTDANTVCFCLFIYYEHDMLSGEITISVIIYY